MSRIYPRYVKRIFDVTGALIILILTFWLMLLICVVYVVTFQLPVFFVQKRIGKDERIFMLYKFRTLKTTGGGGVGRTFAWGQFLRRTSLDELPQLFNVLKGEMSLVGPRPLPEQYLPLFDSAQRTRHTVKPGITGYAQVKGRHKISWEKKFELDLHYIQNQSLMLDLWIIIKTVLVLLSFKKDESLREEPFTGTTK